MSVCDGAWELHATAHSLRVEDNLGSQFSLGCRQGFFVVCHFLCPQTSAVSTSHLAIGNLGLHTWMLCLTVCGFWGLELKSLCNGEGTLHAEPSPQPR